MATKLTTEQFIAKAQAVHGLGKYDYSRVVYRGNREKVKIICSVHGPLEQLADSHLRGIGCPKCGRIIAGKNYTARVAKSFLDRARALHCDKYDYSKSSVARAKDEITIICPIHGAFEQTLHKHLGGRGCPRCGTLRRTIATQATRIDALARNGKDYYTRGKDLVRRKIVDGKAQCSKCGELKPLQCFTKQSSSPIGLKSHCKECVAKRLAELLSPEYRAKKNAYSKANKDRIKRYREVNKDAIYLQRKAFRESLPPEKKAELREYNRKRQKSINSWLANNCRARVRHALRGKIKSEKTRILMGCTAEQLRAHLESRFLPGMNWGNYGRRHDFGAGWEVDHIAPCRAFDLTVPEQQLKCFHYTNLQPLWAVDNRRKNATI